MIRDLSAEERPREKAMHAGIKTLTDIELMATIFATGVTGKSAVDLAREILADNGGHLSKVARLSVGDFCARYKGVGPVKAINLLAARELGGRAAADARRAETPQLTSSQAVYEVMQPRFRGLNHEEFWVVMLDRGMRLMKETRVSQGGTAATVVDVKMIVKAVAETLASAVILCHNHPSGTLTPSAQDDRLTTKIVNALGFLDVTVADHLIFTDSGYYSYNDMGRIH